MAMHKALHSRDDVDRLYESRKEGEREDSSALKIMLMYQYKDSNITLKMQRKTDYSDQKQ